MASCARVQIDLDTIDLSNLNRQFLFQKQHVKRPKALVAKETASKFNPHVKINAIHGNIKEQQYDVDWFGGFDLVMNALDNLGRRRKSGSFVFVGLLIYCALPQMLVNTSTRCAWQPIDL